MPTPEELEQKLWASITADMTLMLGLDGVEEGQMRPMTALVEDARPPIWIFTSRDTAMAAILATSKPATAAFASKGHDLFATLHGPRNAARPVGHRQRSGCYRSSLVSICRGLV